MTDGSNNVTIWRRNFDWDRLFYEIMFDKEVPE